MQPLFSHNLLLLNVLVVSFLIWIVIEVRVEIRQHKRIRTGAQLQDKGSRVVLNCLITLGQLLCALLASAVPAAAIAGYRGFLFWLGLLLVYVGIALRLYAIKVLGAYFTTTVAVAPEQPVIEEGPYRLIRHPAYTGSLITLLGGSPQKNSSLIHQEKKAALAYGTGTKQEVK
jgi:protein-S-isoprenylcysteine O-methyltransferase Ste14